MLAAFQDLLGLLATDAGTRARFADDREGFLRAFPSDEGDRRLLRAIALHDLARFADGLIAKRWQEVRRVVPLSLVVAPRLAVAYRTWLAEHPAPAQDTVLPPGPAEALRALPTLAGATLHPALAAYAPDLLSFEVLSACSLIDGAGRRLRAGFAVHDIVADLRRGVLPMDPPPVPHEYRFERGGAQHRRLT